MPFSDDATSSESDKLPCSAGASQVAPSALPTIVMDPWMCNQARFGMSGSPLTLSRKDFDDIEKNTFPKGSTQPKGPTGRGPSAGALGRSGPKHILAFMRNP